MEWHRSWTREVSSGEYMKIGLTLDEEDLKRIVSMSLPGVATADLAPREVFQLMEMTAESYLTAEAARVFSYPDTQTAIARIAALTTSIETLLNSIRERF